MKVSQLQISRAASLAATVLLVNLASGCGRAEFQFSNGSTLGQLEPPTVCVPGTTPGTSQNGLAGSIRYLESANPSPRPGKVDDILNSGKDPGVKLILSDLNIPTVAFTQGFVDPVSGQAVKNSNGDVLTEWFAIDMKSSIMLKDSEPEGYYQLALLSDDGAVMDIDVSATSAGSVAVDNDGEHSTKMGCGASAVYLKHNEPRAIRVRYYQGPRYHIALTMMWRKAGSASSAKDAYCGQSGNDLFWNSNVTPSAPTSKYNDLVSRGWKVPSPENFILPAGSTNTCI
ncbi:MAG: hypothetical protein JST04_03070 [Bdellovibrionales bacterium]|nr:hypothetical protein [Bdellovibrionales bacterium]